jgi:hypothetical protein
MASNVIYARVAKDVWDRVHELARVSGRSIAKQIEFMLRAYEDCSHSMIQPDGAVFCYKCGGRLP